MKITLNEFAGSLAAEVARGQGQRGIGSSASEGWAMSGLYEIVWQVQADRPDLSRKACQGGSDRFYAHHDRDGILDGFPDPEVIDLGDELVIWQRLQNGALAAEGWRRMGGEV